MENFGIFEIGIIALVIFIKFGLILGMVFWSKSNAEKKKRQFLEEQERIKAKMHNSNY